MTRARSRARSGNRPAEASATRPLSRVAEAAVSLADVKLEAVRAFGALSNAFLHTHGVIGVTSMAVVEVLVPQGNGEAIEFHARTSEAALRLAMRVLKGSV